MFVCELSFVHPVVDKVQERLDHVAEKVVQKGIDWLFSVRSVSVDN